MEATRLVKKKLPEGLVPLDPPLKTRQSACTLLATAANGGYPRSSVATALIERRAMFGRCAIVHATTGPPRLLLRSARSPRSSAALAFAACVAAALAFAPLFVRVPPAAAAAPIEYETVVTIAHTNDIHSHLMPDENDREPVGGMSRIATIVKDLQRKCDYLLVVDAGDCMLGTPFYSFYGGRAEIECMNAVGYDAAVVGNHELDAGVETFLALSEKADFPFLSANILWRRSGEPVFTPHLVFEGDDLRIALLGLTTGSLHGRVRPSALRGISSGDPVEAAKRIVPELRREAQVVVVLSHIGVGRDKKLAAEVPGIDLIIGGDSHTLLEKPIEVRDPGSGRSTYIVQAGSEGRYVGRVNMYFSGESLMGIDACVIPVVSSVAQDREAERTAEKYWNSIADRVSEVVARAKGPFPRDKSMKWGESPLGDLVADITRDATGADIALQNAGGVRDGFDRGAITVWDVYCALPFDNKLVTVEMKGSKVTRLMNEIARRRGRNSFCQVSGITFEIDGDAARNIKIGGRPLEPERRYTVGLIDYMAEGGDHYGILADATVIRSSDSFQRDIAVEYLRSKGTISPRLDGRIKVVRRDR